MSPLTLTIAMFSLLFLLLISGCPLFAAITLVSIIFGLLVKGFEIFPILAMRIYTLMTSYSLVAVPLFILMANFLQRSGIVDEIFNATHAWAGRIRGSIAIATVVSGTILAAMVGIVGASVVALGLLALPGMLKYGYERKLALGTICAAGALGILIPPSIMPLFYSAVTATSAVDLFAASIFPGLLLASLYVIYILSLLSLKPHYAPSPPVSFTWKEKFFSLRNLIAPAIIIAVVLGVILKGIASPTEASGVGAFAVALLLIIRRKFTWELLKDSLLDTIRATGMVMWIAFGATCFVGVYAAGGGDVFATSLLGSLPGGKWGALIFTQIVYIILGMFIDWIGICLLFVPIFTSALVSMGFDPVWLGLLFMVNMQVSFLSPPFGYALFYLKGISPPDVRTEEIWRGALPFLICQLLGLVICILFPPLSLWLPNVLH